MAKSFDSRTYTMPLHLLGKKSWNVYNPENIERVRRDEASARAQEAEDERKKQKRGAEERFALLRGESSISEEKAQTHDAASDRKVKKRRLAGEDDTDRDIRLARHGVPEQQPERRVKHDYTPLFDKAGHIDLLGQHGGNSRSRNPEVEAEAAQKQREYEDQYTMRFINAAGKDNSSRKLWYDSTETTGSLDAVSVAKDVWGREDPRRKEREQQRLHASDPLMAIKKGVRQLREAEKHRNEWKEQREKDLKEVEDLARQHRPSKPRRNSDNDSLDGFDLDQGYKSRPKDRLSPKDSERHGRQEKTHRRRQQKHRHSHRRQLDRDCNRSRSRSPRRHRSRTE